VGYVDVYRNGVYQPSADYTATTGTTVVLTNAATVGDTITTISFYVSSVLNAIPNSPASVSSSNLAALSTIPSTAGNITVPAVTGTMMVSGNMPAFSAYLATSNQSVTSSTWTALSAQTKEFDTATAYNNTGSTTTLNGISVPAYSFAPNVAGYYQVNGEINATCTAGSQMNIAVYKNGSEFKRGFAIVGGAFSQYCLPVSALIYMNGTSDYITLYGVIVGTSPVYVSGTGAWSYFQAVLARI